MGILFTPGKAESRGVGGRTGKSGNGQRPVVD